MPSCQLHGDARNYFLPQLPWRGSQTKMRRCGVMCNSSRPLVFESVGRIFLLGAAGEQEENGLGPSGGRPAILRVPRTDAQRIACRQVACHLSTSPTWNAGRRAVGSCVAQDRCAKDCASVYVACPLAPRHRLRRDFQAAQAAHAMVCFRPKKAKPVMDRCL